MTDQNETVFNLNVTPDTIDEEIKKAIDLHRLLRQPDFEYWFEEWEKGFPEATLQRSAGNFQLGGEKPWRGKSDERPRYREWTSKEQREKWGYRQIEYWKNRANESKSFFLQGTDAELIKHILQLEYEGGGSNQTEENDLIAGGEVKRRGKPQIFLFFREDDEDIEPGWRAVESKISFRLMDETDTSISIANLKNITRKIEDNFSASGGRIWRRGKDMAGYTYWEQGYQLQLLSRNKADATELIKAILAIQEHTFAAKYVTYNENQDPAAAYPVIPENVTILGKLIKGPRKRPIADVRFQWASLRLSSTDKSIFLVDRSGTKDIFPAVA